MIKQARVQRRLQADDRQASRERRECTLEGCFQSTHDRKAFCQDHGRLNGYASRFYELEQIEKHGVRAVTIDGGMAQEILGLVTKDGFLGMKDAVEYIGIEKPAVACYFSALQSAGLAKIAMDEFGVCLQRLEKDEAPQHPVIGPQPEERHVPIYLGTVEGIIETPEEPEEKDMNKGPTANEWGHGITLEEFKSLVDDHGMKRTEIGRHVGIHASQVGHWFRGHVAPNKENQAKLAELLDRVGAVKPSAPICAADDGQAWDESPVRSESHGFTAPTVATEPEPDPEPEPRPPKPKPRAKKKKAAKAKVSVEVDTLDQVVEVLEMVTRDNEPLLSIAGRRAAGWLHRIAAKLEARATRGRNGA